MSLASRTERRALPVRLTDISLSARMKAARSCMKQEPAQGPALLTAALCPSPTTYYVHASAADLIERIAA